MTEHNKPSRDRLDPLEDMITQVVHIVNETGQLLCKTILDFNITQQLALENTWKV
jgi:hypothetical protein